MALNNRIKEARLKRNLTQEQLASLVGVAKSTITGYEKGNRIPTAAMVGLIADATGVDANFLFQDEVTELYKDKATPEEFENIVKKYRDLDDHGKEMVDFTLRKEWERCDNAAKTTKTDAKIAALESENCLNAAHNIGATSEQKAHADSIMEDDSEWE